MTEIESLTRECVRAPAWRGEPRFEGRTVRYGGAAWGVAITLTPDPSHGWHVASELRVDGQIVTATPGTERAHTDGDAARLIVATLRPERLIPALDAAAGGLPALRAALEEQQRQTAQRQRELLAARESIERREAQIAGLIADLQAAQAAADLVAAQLGEALAEIERLRAERVADAAGGAP